jgi:hypothetical protein
VLNTPLDRDNDGDQDLFLAAVGPQVLLENRWVPEGRVRFLDVSEEAGVGVPAVGFSASAADVNGDSYPDVYVTSYNRYGDVMPNSWDRATNGTPNLLLVSRGDGTYREEARERGIADGRWSYAASFADADGDGDQDLFVANDFGEDGFFRNDGGRFTDVTQISGLAFASAGAAALWLDVDNDGRLDLLTTALGFLAVVFATINVVGGFLVTHRMLGMFRRKE